MPPAKTKKEKKRIMTAFLWRKKHMENFPRAEPVAPEKGSKKKVKKSKK